MVVPAWLAGGIGLIAGGFGKEALFFGRRFLTGSQKQERVTYLSTVAEFGRKLKDSGMSMDQVAALERLMMKPLLARHPEVGESFMADEATLNPKRDESNYAMKMRAAADLEVAEAKLGKTIAELRLMLSESENLALERTQAKWLDYRDALSEAARVEYEGGTHAGLAAALTAIAETERRTTELDAETAERSRR